MKTFSKIILMVLFGATILYAGDGLSQPHLVSTTPSPNDDNVPPNTTLSFTFDSTIVEKSIKPHTITLKQKEPSKHNLTFAPKPKHFLRNILQYSDNTH